MRNYFYKYITLNVGCIGRFLVIIKILRNAGRLLHMCRQSKTAINSQTLKQPSM